MLPPQSATLRCARGVVAGTARAGHLDRRWLVQESTEPNDFGDESRISVDGRHGVGAGVTMMLPCRLPGCDVSHAGLAEWRKVV